MAADVERAAVGALEAPGFGRSFQPEAAQSAPVKTPSTTPGAAFAAAVSIEA
jgi:hypothetical protein